MAFVLVAPPSENLAVTRPYTSGNVLAYRRLPEAETAMRRRIVGVVTLHAYGDDLAGFSKGWSPVVSFLQTYLANILMQVARLAGRETTVKDLLLHEVTNVVRSSKKHMEDVFEQVQELRQGRSRTLAMS